MGRERLKAGVIDGSTGQLVDSRDATVMSFKTDKDFRQRVQHAAKADNQTVTAYIKQLINRDLERKGL